MAYNETPMKGIDMLVEKIHNMSGIQLLGATAKEVAKLAACYAGGAIVWHVSLRVLDCGLSKIK